MPTLDLVSAVDEKERGAQRATQRAALLVDSTTRMPRVVRLTANEARTIDSGSKLLTKRGDANWCVICGHLSVFHTIGDAVLCTVLDCECETCGLDLDREEQERLRLEERARLFRKAYSPWRWGLPLVVGLIALGIGKWIL